MPRIYLVLASLFAALAVAAGAFGAHGLQQHTNDEKLLKSFQTAAQYQMYHALGLLAISALYGRFSSPLLKWVANFFVIGILLFSGSLYLLVLMKINGNDTSFVGPVTPIGGVFFLAGWVLLLFSVLRRRANS